MWCWWLAWKGSLKLRRKVEARCFGELPRLRVALALRGYHKSSDCVKNMLRTCGGSDSVEDNSLSIGFYIHILLRREMAARAGAGPRRGFSCCLNARGRCREISAPVQSSLTGIHSTSAISKSNRRAPRTFSACSPSSKPHTTAAASRSSYTAS